MCVLRSDDPPPPCPRSLSVVCIFVIVANVPTTNLNMCGNNHRTKFTDVVETFESHLPPPPPRSPLHLSLILCFIWPLTSAVSVCLSCPHPRLVPHQPWPNVKQQQQQQIINRLYLVVNGSPRASPVKRTVNEATQCDRSAAVRKLEHSFWLFRIF